MSNKHDKPSLSPRATSIVKTSRRTTDVKPTSSGSVAPASIKSKEDRRSSKPEAKSAAAALIQNTRDFYLDDFSKTLFPLKTNRVLVERGEEEIRAFIDRCLDDNENAYAFSSQTRAYAAKPANYLRRTVKLDPVSEFYIYDVVYRNKALFRKPYTEGRKHYGYRFEHGTPIPPTAAYKAFKGALSEYGKNYTHSLSFDIASYFNNIYHHDIVSWFVELGAENRDAEGMGQLLREINSGRSIDCLPQGLYPTKMIGNDFLRFIDNYYDLKSEKLVRFMDDFYLFSSNEQNLTDDFQLIQRLLGDKGLSINPTKTTRNTAGHVAIQSGIDSVKRTLLDRRRKLIVRGYDEDGREITEEVMSRLPLTAKELAYIDEILQKSDIEEEDAELILTIMGSHTRRVESRLPYILQTYPHLTKNVYKFCAAIKDKDLVSDMVLAVARNQRRLMEYQLFWLCAILEDYLLGTEKTSALISVLYNHPSATSITKAKVLEISDRRYGLPELRHGFLASGQSDWLAWSSAVGSRELKPLSLNHRLKYFGRSSPINRLIASIMMK